MQKKRFVPFSYRRWTTVALISSSVVLLVGYLGCWSPESSPLHEPTDGEYANRRGTQQPVWFLEVVFPDQDTVFTPDSLTFTVVVEYNVRDYGKQFPYGAQEPGIVRIVADSSYTSRILKLAVFQIAFCTRDWPQSNCTGESTIDLTGLIRGQKYYYFASLVSDPTVHSPIRSLVWQ